MKRRTLFVSAAASAAAVSLTALGAAPSYADPRTGGRPGGRPGWKLPGEVSRSRRFTEAGAEYDNVEVDIDGDLARIFIPNSVGQGGDDPVAAVWFYHSAKSSHDALEGGFRYPGELVVDQGAIAICIDAGGTQFTSPVAQRAQLNAWDYLSSLFAVRMNFLRATSAGGALACYTYGEQLMPYIRGLYLVNGVYDLESPFDLGEHDTPALRALIADRLDASRKLNPARIPASSWGGANVKVVVSASDAVVPPATNGLALIGKIDGIAGDTRVARHDEGHGTPSFTNRDMIQTFGDWSRRQ